MSIEILAHVLEKNYKKINRLGKDSRLKGNGRFYALVRGSRIKITSKRMDAG
jgi:uncharacterized protein YajQ (UPF0234 family)